MDVQDVSRRKEIAEVLRVVTPTTFADALGYSAPYEDVDLSLFDPLYKRACAAAVRVVTSPTIIPRDRVGEFEWAIRNYVKQLVLRRDQFGRRAARLLPKRSPALAWPSQTE